MNYCESFFFLSKLFTLDYDFYFWSLFISVWRKFIYQLQANDLHLFGYVIPFCVLSVCVWCVAHSNGVKKKNHLNEDKTDKIARQQPQC